MSELYMLEIKNTSVGADVVFEKTTESIVPKHIFKTLKNNVFVYLTNTDISILNKVNSKKEFTLQNSIFGLGVVTGNNKEKLLDNPTDNSEPIYSGKEVSKYKLLPAKKHIVFNRNELQQVASDAIYRAPKKLVYKTINKCIKVALDTTQSLTTNSANIVIPIIDGVDIYTIMGLLNSQIYSFLNIKMFGGVNKIAKENLQSLPLPKLSNTENLQIKELVLLAINTDDDTELQKFIHQNIFNLSEDEVEYINLEILK